MGDNTMTTDWKPKNPCEKCGLALVGCDYANCFAKYEQVGGIKAQKKVLEYLITEGKQVEDFWMQKFTNHLESMLKQLEDL